MFEETTNPEEESFLESVNRFLAEAEWWLTDEDYPAVVTLRRLAKSLDERLHPPLVQQFGLTYRNLLKRAPGASEDGDELDDIIPD